MNSPIVKRNIATCIILSIVTCGIYSIYWFVCLVNDLNRASNEEGAASGGVVFLLILVTCGIYGWFWYYKAGQQVSKIQAARTGRGDSNNSLIYLVLGILGLGIVNYCLIQNELNQIAQD